MPDNCEICGKSISMAHVKVVDDLYLCEYCISNRILIPNKRRQKYVRIFKKQKKVGHE
ncbi:hypothetical protein LCGC14_2229900 [marine sediment metagenome]|uniref:Uncharacterized protein n=1 Tax=marine sediment metagenome TaxID=412755 RepID=A0A0F9G3S3_9ZZZZ